MPEKGKVFAAFAVTIGMFALLPQIVKVIQMKKADELSYIWMGLALLVQICWICYGISNKFCANIIGGIIGIIMYSILVGLKFKYSKKK